jgi:23S rRNA-/tRNA-specific pseudouridylate synthase
MGDRLAKGNEDEPIPNCAQALTPQQLLRLGSVWYLSNKQYQHNQLEIPYSNFKPSRLDIENSTMMLEQGDYLRIHHTPRRFPNVYDFDWRDHHNIDASYSTTPSNSQHAATVVYSNVNFWIINKPPLIPVHATVDNAQENIVHQLSEANPTIDYVVTTQRLDINTSGLLVVAKRNEFAAYFAQLLRHKTKSRHGEQDMVKRYTCLVCLQAMDEEGESIVDAWQRLQSLQNTTIRHYLEPSERAPKRFELTAPAIENEENNDPSSSEKMWLECLLQITNVSKIVPIPYKDHALAKKLWTSAAMPSSTKAVCEVSIQLETGRTHQIRGQLSKLGYPLVGDEQYGGAIPEAVEQSDEPQLLALQSSFVGFWDADYEQVWNRRRRKFITQGVKSDRWVETSLDTAWWRPILDKEGVDDDMTSSADVDLANSLKSLSSRVPPFGNTERLELLPPTVQLSPGRNKYVLVKVGSSISGHTKWFVKSATPTECGGPYHANVAEDLVEWLHAAGFDKVTVTGGGRIDFNPSSNRAHVYGFSFGFGKGDHQRAAALISEAGYSGTYDNSNALY